MKKLVRKLLVSLIILIFVFQVLSSLVLNAGAQTEGCSVFPTPVSSGQPVQFYGWNFQLGSLLIARVTYPDGHSVLTPEFITNIVGGFQVSFTPSQLGHYSVQIINYAGHVLGAVLATTAFDTTLSSVSVTPNPAYAGDLVNIGGDIITGVPPLTVKIKIDFPDGTSVTSVAIATDTNGIFTYSPASAFTLEIGIYLISVLDAATNVVYVQSALTVKQPPEIVLNPSAGPAGTLVTATCYGFDPNTVVTIEYWFESDGSSSIVVSGLSDGYGDFSEQFYVPYSTEGDHFVDAYQNAGSPSAETVFTVSPTSIVLSPSIGRVGDSVDVTCSGFDPNTVVTIDYWLGTDETSSFAASGTSNAYGGLITSFTVPPTTAGDLYVEAYEDTGTAWADTTFTVLPSIVLSPSTGPVGTLVDVAGSGFDPSAVVTIYYLVPGGDGGIPAITLSANSDSYGSFSSSFTVPYCTPGDYTVNAYDNDGSASDSALFTVTAFGSPPGITVKNTVSNGAVPDSWNYQITDSNGAVVDTFTLAASGGGTHTYPFTSSVGATFSVTATPKVGYYTATSVQTDALSTYQIYETLPNPNVTVDLSTGGWATVTFDNSAGSFASAVLGTGLPTDFSYSIPLNKAVPVQAAFNVDYNNDHIFDDVVNKTMAIMVNFTIPTAGAAYQVRVTVGGTNGVDLIKNVVGPGVVTFYPITIDKPFGMRTLTGQYRIGQSGSWTYLVGSPTQINVVNTYVLPLYYACINRADYGKVTDANYNLMEQSSTQFINATYPVKNVAVNKTTEAIAGNTGTGTAALAADCTRLATMARVTGNTTRPIGIGVVSSTYFTTLGQDQRVVAYTANPNTKGVLVMDGYYTAAAHEIGHTYNQYIGGLAFEEYSRYPQNGKATSGVSAQLGQWRTGFDIMGAVGYQTTDLNWIWNDTYAKILNRVVSTATDPEILVASGLIYKDGRVVLNELNGWYHIQGGVPDDIVPGDFSLNFVDKNGNTISETSFDAPFFASIDPGLKIGENQPNLESYGNVPTDVTSFAFAIQWPTGGAEVAAVQLMDNRNGGSVPMGSPVTVDEIIEVQPQVTANSYFTDTNFEPINSFNVLFTKTSSKASTLTVTATDPATYYYTLDFKNNGGALNSVPITVNIPDSFKLTGNQPVQIDFNPVSYTFTDGVLHVTVPNVAAGQTFTLRVHLDYKLKSTTGYPSNAPTTYHSTYIFSTNINGAFYSAPTIEATGKKATAIGGFATDSKGALQSGLKVNVYKGLTLKWSTEVDGDGYYYADVAAGGPYSLVLIDSFGAPVGANIGINVATDTYAPTDLKALPINCAIQGFVKDSLGNPVVGVKVQISGPLEHIQNAAATTNSGGHYIFRFILPGTYILKITAPPGYTSTHDTQSIRVRLTETGTVNFTLIRIGP